MTRELARLMIFVQVLTDMEGRQLNFPSRVDKISLHCCIDYNISMLPEDRGKLATRLIKGMWTGCWSVSLYTPDTSLIKGMWTGCWSVRLYTPDTRLIKGMWTGCWSVSLYTPDTRLIKGMWTDLTQA